jgi:ribosomal protein S18 acetylase RimI-like enzyme
LDLSMADAPLPDFEILDLTPADYSAVMELWNAADGVRPNETFDEFCRILARNPGLCCLARVGGALAAAVLCGHDGRRGYLYHLAVAPAFRRRGIGQALVDRCLARLAEAGIRRATIFLVVENDGGARFWQRIGWRERTDLKTLAKDLP